MRLKKEKKGVLLFSVDPLDVEQEAIYFLQPIAAVIIALFDGERGPEDVACILSKAFDISMDSALRLVQKVLREFNEYFIEYSQDDDRKGLYKKYDPREFVYCNNEKEELLIRTETPINLVYVVTKKCLCRCIYCYANAGYRFEEKLLPFSRLIEIFDEAATIGVSTVMISGGEPFLRPDIIKVINYIKQKGLFVIISTRAGLSEEIVKQLKDAGLQKIQVSIDASNPKLANFLAGSKDCYQQAIQTIKLSIKNGIEVKTNTVITAYNINDIPNLIALLANLGVAEINLTPYARSLGRHRESLFASTEDLKRLLFWVEEYQGYSNLKKVTIRYADDVIRRLGNPQSRESFDQRLFCTAGKLGLVILPDGKVTICERLADVPQAIVGDLMSQTLLEIWNSEALLRLIYPEREKYRGTECYQCEQFDACTKAKGRCFVRSLIAYGTLCAPDPLCNLAPPIKQRLV
jgi:radical SAM protein with 4Fe4S-binding SPASM domain